MAETPMNPVSSRSHCVFTVHISSRASGDRVYRHAKLNLVDLAGASLRSAPRFSGYCEYSLVLVVGPLRATCCLTAGSERVGRTHAEGLQLREAKCINLSLHYLQQAGPPPPHLHRDWARPRHICTGTGPAPATSAPGLGPPLPHLRRGTGPRRRIARTSHNSERETLRQSHQRTAGHWRPRVLRVAVAHG